MRLIKSIMRTVVLMLLVVSGTMSVMADTTHVVNRGETLQSIAQKYGVAVDQIIAANPQASQFIYVGMELTIPGSAVQAPAVSEQYLQNVDGSAIQPTQVIQPESGVDNYGPMISQWGIDYIANFVDKGKGFYGLFFEAIGESGWGGFFSVGASYGIIKPGQLHLRFGPDYGVSISDMFVLSLPVALNMTTFDHVSEATYHDNVGTTSKKDMKIAWGLSATPKIAFKVEKVHLNLGLDINYNFEKKLTSEYKNMPVIGNIKSEQKFGGKAYVGFFAAIGL